MLYVKDYSMKVVKVESVESKDKICFRVDWVDIADTSDGVTERVTYAQLLTLYDSCAKQGNPLKIKGVSLKPLYNDNADTVLDVLLSFYCPLEGADKWISDPENDKSDKEYASKHSVVYDSQDKKLSFQRGVFYPDLSFFADIGHNFINIYTDVIAGDNILSAFTTVDKLINKNIRVSVDSDNIRLEYSDDRVNWTVFFKLSFRGNTISATNYNIPELVARYTMIPKYSNKDKLCDYQVYALQHPRRDYVVIDALPDVEIDKWLVDTPIDWKKPAIAAAHNTKTGQKFNMLFGFFERQEKGKYWDVIVDTSYNTDNFDTYCIGCLILNPDIHWVNCADDSITFYRDNDLYIYSVSPYDATGSYFSTCLLCIRKARYTRRLGRDGIVEIYDKLQLNGDGYVCDYYPGIEGDAYIVNENDNLFGIEGVSDIEYYSIIDDLRAKYCNHTVILGDLFNNAGKKDALYIYKNMPIKKLPGTDIKCKFKRVAQKRGNLMFCIQDKEYKLPRAKPVEKGAMHTYLCRYSLDNYYSIGIACLYPDEEYAVAISLDDLTEIKEVFQGYNIIIKES